MEYAKTVHIDAKPSQVWRVLSDVKRWPTWTDSMVEVTRISSGDLREGSKLKLHQPKGKARIWTITEFDEDRSLAWKTSSPTMTMTAGHDISEDDGGSKVDLTFSMSGLLAGLGSMMAAGRIRAWVDMEAEGLKKKAEADH